MFAFSTIVENFLRHSLTIRITQQDENPDGAGDLGMRLASVAAKLPDFYD